MTNDPEQIRTDIERTHSELSENVDALRDKVSPSSVARRQTQRFRGAASSVKDRVMGVASDVGSAGGSAVSTVGETASRTPTMVRERTEGNPMAAGLIAFGTGWLVSALIPVSKRERDAAAAVKDQASSMTQDLSDTAKEMADDLREPAQQAVQSVQSTAAEAADTVKEEATSAAQDIKEEAQSSKDNVQRSGS